MSEPLSKLKPPDTMRATEEKAVPFHKTGESLEWMLVDFDATKMPGMETFLPGVWERMHKDGTFEMFFHEGPNINFIQFGAIMTDPANKIQLVGGYDKDGTAKEHAGIVMLTHILVNDVVKRAVGNFLFFHEYWHRADSLSLGHAVLDHWFGKMEFDVIAGITPRANRAAITFIKRLGFQVVGDVPGFTMYEGKPCASATSFMTRQMWAAKAGK